MKKKHEGAVFVCGHCLTSTHWSGAVPSAPDRWADLRLWRSECRTHPLVGGSPTTHGRWEPLHGGQGGISLEYQTYTSAYLFDTLVTGKAWTSVWYVRAPPPPRLMAASSQAEPYNALQCTRNSTTNASAAQMHR